MSYNTAFLQPTSLASSFTSPPAQLIDAGLIAIQAKFTGSTCNFTAEVWTSCEEYTNNRSFVPTELDPYPNSSQTFTEAGTFTWNISQSGFVWVVLVITDNSSGTNNGTISARINVKGPL